MESFPDACRGRLDAIVSMLYHHLHDKTWSVREEAAITLGVLVKAFGKESFDRLFAAVCEVC